MDRKRVLLASAPNKYTNSGKLSHKDEIEVICFGGVLDRYRKTQTYFYGAICGFQSKKACYLRCAKKTGGHRGR